MREIDMFFTRSARFLRLFGYRSQRLFLHAFVTNLSFAPEEDPAEKKIDRLLAEFEQLKAVVQQLADRQG